MRSASTIATRPRIAPASCRLKNQRPSPNRAPAYTADALYTITTPSTVRRRTEPSSNGSYRKARAACGACEMRMAAEALTTAPAPVP